MTVRELDCRATRENMMRISTIKMGLSLCAVVALVLSACGGGEMTDSSIKKADINDVSPEDWEELAAKTIYFGHQSVGGNIVEGVERVMQEHPQVQLSIKEARGFQDLNGPVFAHSAIGKNRDPQSKINDFKSKMHSGMGERVDIALFKFCYVDFSGDTDINAMFEEYASAMDELQREYPNVNFVHSTVPLEVAGSPLKNKIKKLIGKPLYQQEANMKRNQFNQLLLDKYSGQSPVFDLAGYESLSAAGKRTSFKAGDGTYFTLNPEYSSDGSHLNSKGQTVIATEFLVFLQSLDK
jgi:hypothetical protein